MSARLTAFIVTPAGRGSRSGNRYTALRWALRLRELGHAVRIEEAWRGQPCDLLIALHARRSHQSVMDHAASQPHAPRVVALTGTDLYGDIHHDASVHETLRAASRLIVLQPRGVEQVPNGLRHKTVVVRQSARAPARPLRITPRDTFLICVLGHLRDVKDPARVALALQRLPSASRVRAVHLGGALEETWRSQALALQRETGERWSWLGDRPRQEALRVLAGSDLLVLSSAMEGGANVIVEAIACGLPIVATQIDGLIGTLGEDHPGYFEVGDTDGLAALIARCERAPVFLESLRERSRALLPLVDPALERDSWAQLLASLALAAAVA